MITFAVRTPKCTHLGLGSCHFARRYFGNRCFFLFLRLLRCFSSPGSPPQLMDWAVADRSLSCRVSPFRYLRINVYLPLPAAFRSLSRLSSALSAKASTLRSFRFFISLVFLGCLRRHLLPTFARVARKRRRVTIIDRDISLSVCSFQGSGITTALLVRFKALRAFSSRAFALSSGKSTSAPA